jgi:membrane protein implicated in regulation of membrane protease activity
MPQFLFLAVAGVIGWWGYRSFLREAERVSARVAEAKKEQDSGAQGTLVLDKETGEYRVRRD